MDDKVDAFLGATQNDGQLKFCIRLKGEPEPIMISSDEAKQKYPYHVLEFYEKNLVWESDDDVDGDDDDDDDDDADDDMVPVK